MNYYEALASYLEANYTSNEEYLTVEDVVFDAITDAIDAVIADHIENGIIEEKK